MVQEPSGQADRSARRSWGTLRAPEHCGSTVVTGKLRLARSGGAERDGERHRVVPHTNRTRDRRTFAHAVVAPSRAVSHARARLRCVAEDWEIVEVDSLPWPHHPFKCRWTERFERVLAAGAPESEHRAAVRDLALSLTPAELAACPYHDADWRAAAAAAVTLAKSGDTSCEALAAVIASQEMDDSTAEALCSFFKDPIFLSDDGLGNGQHRVCAMKLAQVPRCPIEP